MTAQQLAGEGFTSGRRREASPPTRLFSRCSVAALILSIATFSVGVVYATTVAAASDAYGYISQADLWLTGQLSTEVPWIRGAPWPYAGRTFSPLGYRTDAPGAGDSRTIVPAYPPGLPLMMAGAKAVGGQEAMFWVVPLFGGLLVLATYGIGCRLGSERAGLTGAWLVATSPAVLFMLVTPMTDVVVAATSALTFFFLLNPTAASALGAGLAAGLTILTRPNLLPCLAIFGLWYVIRIGRDGRGRRKAALRDGLIFATGALPGPTALVILNAHWYGSPLASGYGNTEPFFALSHVVPNIWRYLWWLVEYHSPAVLAGLAAVLVPARALWPGVRDRAVFIVISGFVLALGGMYLVYTVFDAWWYLRFLLPAFPFMMVGVGAIIEAVRRRTSRRTRSAIAVGVLCLGAYQLTMAVRASAFNLWRGSREYVSIARMVHDATDAHAVVLSMEYSGSVRYYGGRMTMRYDFLGGRWLDRSVSWLTEHGAHPYLLVADWELPQVMQQFAGQDDLKRAQRGAMLTFTGAATVFLFDLARPAELGPVTATVYEAASTHLRSAPPVAPPPPPFN